MLYDQNQTREAHRDLKTFVDHYSKYKSVLNIFIDLWDSNGCLQRLSLTGDGEGK